MARSNEINRVLNRCIIVLISVCVWSFHVCAQPADSSSGSPVIMQDTSTNDGEILMADEPADDNTASQDSAPAVASMPELKQFIEAVYPPEIYRQGIEGTVLMEMVVSDSGTVDSVAVIRGFYPALDSSAMRAARRFIFSPAKLSNGEPVAVLLQYEYRFSLSEVVEKMERYPNFTGRLLERGTKIPIADAMVVIRFIDTLSDTTLGVPFSAYRARLGRFEGQYLEEDRLVAVTGSLGQFTFYSLPACSIEVASPLAGYEEFRETEVITPGEQLSVIYHVRRISYSDYEIVVYGKVEEKEVTRHQLTIQEIKKIPGLGGDAVKVVQAMSGVARPSFGGTDIIVRGAPTSDSRFFLDGVELPLLYHFGGLKSTYNSEALQNIDFYPGGWGTRYGGATAGIVELTSRAPKTDRWHGILDLSSLDGSFLVEGPLNEKVSIIASARRSFIGEFLKLIYRMSPEEPAFTLYPFYWDFLLRTNIAFSRKSHAFVTGFGLRDTMGLIIPSMQGGSEEVSEATNSLGMKITFLTGLCGWDYAFSENLNNSMRYSLTRGQSDVSIFGFVTVNETNYTHHVRDQVTVGVREGLRLNIGLDMSLMKEDLALQIPQGNNTVQRDTTNDWWFGVLGGYINCEWKPLENLLFVPGLRYDFFPELDYHGAIVPEFWKYHIIDNTCRFSGEPSARLTGRYEFTKKHTVKGSIGNYSQTPEPLGQVIHESWGNPHMPATKAAHYVLGYEWRITDLVRADVQGYVNTQWNIPRMATQEDQLANPGVLWLPDGKGRMRGLEFMLRHDQSERFFGWFTYTLARSERYNPNADGWELYDQDETHNVQLLGSWHLRRDWDLGFRLRYVTGKPTTPIIDVVEFENYNGFYPVYGEENSARMDPFFQLDVRMDKKFVFNKWMFSIYVDVQNLSWLLYKSPEMEIHNYDYSDKQTVSMIIQPAIGYKAEF